MFLVQIPGMNHNLFQYVEGECCDRDCFAGVSRTGLFAVPVYLRTGKLTGIAAELGDQKEEESIP